MKLNQFGYLNRCSWQRDEKRNEKAPEKSRGFKVEMIQVSLKRTKKDKNKN